MNLFLRCCWLGVGAYYMLAQNNTELGLICFVLSEIFSLKCELFDSKEIEEPKEK